MKKNLSIVHLVKKQSKYIFLGMMFALISVLIQLSVPWIMKEIIDTAIPRKGTYLLISLIIALAFLPFVAAILISIRSLFLFKIGGYITDQLRKELFAKLTRFSPKTYNQFKAGDIVSRIYSCGEVGDLFISQAVIPAILDGTLFVGIFIVMFLMNWKLSLLVLGIVPFVYFLSQRISRKAQNAAGQVIRLQQEMNVYATEFVAGLKTVQMFNQEQKEKDFQSDWIKTYRKIRNRTAFVENFANLIVDFGKALGLSLVFSFGAWQVINGDLTVGSLLAFTVYFPQLFGALQTVQFALIKKAIIRPRIDLIYEILDMQEDVPENKSENKKIKGLIEFRNVSFSYPDGRGKVEKLTFTVNPGEFIALVGPSGGGKTTILDLIMRFYEPQKGIILIDGIDLSNFSHFDIRENISIVPQDVFLWNRSIKENILYANPRASMDEIQKACRQAQILDFIESLPNKWDTIVGERGVKLSGGEKQRIAIARALVRDPQILLLDEPTSALDAETESFLQDQLELLSKDKTLIVVAHRLATIKNADRIFVIKDGQIKESGSHTELLKNRDIYFQLFTEQFQSFGDRQHEHGN